MGGTKAAGNQFYKPPIGKLPVKMVTAVVESSFDLAKETQIIYRMSKRYSGFYLALKNTLSLQFFINSEGTMGNLEITSNNISLLNLKNGGKFIQTSWFKNSGEKRYDITHTIEFGDSDPPIVEETYDPSTKTMKKVEYMSYAAYPPQQTRVTVQRKIRIERALLHHSGMKVISEK